MTTFCYDLEVFRNLFTATFVNSLDEEEKHVFYVGLNKTDYSDIKEFLKQEMTLVGYNCISFDDPILRFIMSYAGEKLSSDIFDLAHKLIDDNFRNDRAIMALRYPREKISTWKSVDLMKILAFDTLGISLKQVAINLKWHKILDLPLPPESIIQKNQLNLILEYNLNDVLITKRLYEEITPLRKLRNDLSVIYSVDLSSASDSKMANLILENTYVTELKTDVRAIRTMRTPREKVLLGDCIARFVKFESQELKEVLRRISSTYVYAYNGYRYSDSMYFANCKFVFGVGGLHTEDSSGKFVSNDEYIIQDMDVSSYYPNLIINNNFYPEHLGPSFIEILKKITAERLGAKKTKDKIKADGLKITINSIFGKLGYEHFWLYDPKQFLSTTISGQMGLMMLVEGMFLNGIEILSCNTDGIICRFHKSLEKTYYDIAHAWEKQTGLELEFTPYRKYVRRDVNSYITEKENGETKEKGVFLKEVDLKKAYHMPIVAKALYNYFIKDIPVRTTLEKCRDIMEFCISQKSGKNFEIELHTGKEIQKLQKTNRFFITTKGGSLFKKDHYSDKRIGLYVGEYVYILNDYNPNIPFKEYHVDLSFYEKEVMKIVNEIEPLQMTLFQVSFQDGGKKIKNTFSTPGDSLEKDEKLTFSQINKLGKNQFNKKIKAIVENNDVVDEISSRYVYIKGFETKAMIAEIYCLSKGITQTIKIDRKAYNKDGLEIGQLIYCDKFEKNNKNEYVIAEYRIVENFERASEKLL